jgi:hypothetical protein
VPFDVTDRTPKLWMDRGPGLRDIHPMWIRPNRTVQARMPSMRPGPAPSNPAALARSRPEAQRPGETPAPAERLQTPDEEARARGGFHESSYELRTGMDLLEGDWPDDTTLPGVLDE